MKLNIHGRVYCTRHPKTMWDAYTGNCGNVTLRKNMTFMVKNIEVDDAKEELKQHFIEHGIKTERPSLLGADLYDGDEPEEGHIYPIITYSIVKKGSQKHQALVDLGYHELYYQP